MAAELKAAGSAAYASGKFREAVEMYTAALDTLAHANARGKDRDEELRGTLLSNRCAARLQMGKVREAAEDAEACVACRPEWPKAHQRLAGCLLRMPDDTSRRKGVKALEKALELDPASASIKEALAQARRTVGGASSAAPSASSSTAPPPPRQSASNTSSSFAERAKSAAESLRAQVSAAFATLATPGGPAALWDNLTDQQRLYAKVAGGLLCFLLARRFFGAGSPSSGFGGGGGGSGGILGFSLTTWLVIASLAYRAYRYPPINEAFADVARSFPLQPTDPQQLANWWRHELSPRGKLAVQGVGGVVAFILIRWLFSGGGGGGGYYDGYDGGYGGGIFSGWLGTVLLLGGAYIASTYFGISPYTLMMLYNMFGGGRGGGYGYGPMGGMGGFGRRRRGGFF